jgi:hypothetical protein
MWTRSIAREARQIGRGERVRGDELVAAADDDGGRAHQLVAGIVRVLEAAEDLCFGALASTPGARGSEHARLRRMA